MWTLYQWRHVAQRSMAQTSIGWQRKLKRTPADQAEPATGVRRGALKDEEEDVRGEVHTRCRPWAPWSLGTYIRNLLDPSLRAPVCVFVNQSRNTSLID
jgi:hypothetical protein